MLMALWLGLMCQATLAQSKWYFDESLDRTIQEIAAKQRVGEQEIKALLIEFEAMHNTPDNRVSAFVPKVATPERVDRLFRMPEVGRLPRDLRVSGLIFAGQEGSTLMRFDKPSDVFAKANLWFPDEMASARKSDERPDIRLNGPFVNWALEAATFMAMWNCLPLETFTDPRANPFRNRPTKNMFLSNKSRDGGETDFGQCVHMRSGNYGVRSNEVAAQLAKELPLMAGRVVPSLQSKFATFLQNNRCRGGGVDDCVLTLHLWASLTPGDVRLAQMLQSLEVDVALNAPLPALKAPADVYELPFEAGSDRFDAVWRRAAFLRAKLRSVLSGVSGWPPQALRETIWQMIALQKSLDSPYARRFDYADVDYRATAISPWQFLYEDLRAPKTGRYGLPPEVLNWERTPRDGATLRQVRTLVLEALPEIEKMGQCEYVKPWLTHELAEEYAFGRLVSDRDGIAPVCVQPDWAWLKEGASEAAVFARTRYQEYLQKANTVKRDEVLSGLTNFGKECFDKKKSGASDWGRPLCDRWIHAPQAVWLKMKNSKLRLDRNRQFRQFVSHAPSESDGTRKTDQQVWLSTLAQGLPGRASDHLGAYAKALHDKEQQVESVNLWRHPGHSRALMEVHMAGGDCATDLLLLTPQGVHKVYVPPRISQRSVCHTDIVRVSDLDLDGRLEAWWAPENWGATRFDSCAGDEGDMRRNLDCTAIDEPAEMAEIDGTALTYFVDNSLSRSEVPNGEVWSFSENVYQLPKVPDIQVAGSEGACNRILIGSVLSQEIGVAEWSDRASAGTEVLDLVCARHPVHPERTIVALFHDLGTASAPEDAYVAGFVVAVIDLQRSRILSIYRSEIEEDGGTRIRGGGKLRLDTARYYLKPNVRAIGVRMNIAYSPHAAEGGHGDQLTLFVEEGKKLRPVLSDLAMSSWEMLDSSGCFVQTETSELPCVIEDQVRTLALAPSSTNGWRDLVLTTTSTVRDSGAPGKRQVERVFRYANGRYDWIH